MPQKILIDGSYGEGGGQIIRTAVALAAITGHTVEIANIRARRTNPGLQRQHLAAVRVAAMLCDAEVFGETIGSSWLRFVPRAAPKADRYTIEVGSAGAATLVAQTAMLPLVCAQGESRLGIVGGTHVPFAPVAEYLETVYAPMLIRMGLIASSALLRAGFNPRGGGELLVEVGSATRLRPLTLTERGKLLDLRVVILTSELPDHVSERGAETVTRLLKGMGVPVAVERRVRPSNGPGAAVCIRAACAQGMAGFSALGERGKPMENVAQEACTAFQRWWRSEAACDVHLADQLVLPQALAEGESRWTTPEITPHLRTVLWIAGQFLPIETGIYAKDTGPSTIVLRGAGIPRRTG